MEIIRQRTFIDHDDKNQKLITIEYTVRSNRKDDLENIFFSFDDFLPNLIIRDEKNSRLPFMGSKDVEDLYLTCIEREKDNTLKIDLDQELKKFRNGNGSLIWISLLHKGMKTNEVRTFSLTYTPKYQSNKNSFVLISIDKEAYPTYYSLFSSEGFSFEDPIFITLKNKQLIPGKTPSEIEKYTGIDSLSLRISPFNNPVILIYELKTIPWKTRITKTGVVVLSFIGIVTLCVNLLEISYSNFSIFVDKTLEMSLFIIASSLVLPRLQQNERIRMELLKYYLVPIIIGLMILFV